MNEEREASRDDVRVYAIFLDDHPPRLGERRVSEPLLAFMRQLPPTDSVAVHDPFDSVTDVAFRRDCERCPGRFAPFTAACGDDTPKHPVEEEHLKHPRDLPRIRREIVTSALEGLATHPDACSNGEASHWPTCRPWPIPSALLKIRLTLGSLGAGDYVVELTTRLGAAAAQQFVAFRLVR